MINPSEIPSSPNTQRKMDQRTALLRAPQSASAPLRYDEEDPDLIGDSSVRNSLKRCCLSKQALIFQGIHESTVCYKCRHLDCRAVVVNFCIVALNTFLIIYDLYFTLVLDRAAQMTTATWFIVLDVSVVVILVRTLAHHV